MKNIVIIASVVLALAGCAGDASEPAVTTTVTQAPSADKSTTPAMDADTQEGVMELAWQQMSEDDKESICVGWAYDEQLMVDTFMGGEANIDEDIVRDFFDGVCS